MATYKIFLVDDDRFLLDMYAVKFKNAGHDVSVFQSAEDALNALRKDETPNAVLVDIIMPNMTGFEFLEAVKKEGLAKDAKLIVLSNQGQDSDIEKAKEFGAAGYIIKASAIPSEVLSETLAIIEKK